jgi:hypothetical protein
MGHVRHSHGAAVAVAGWYPSPDGLGQRWWDGGRWTDQWMRAGRQGAPADTRSPGIRLRDALTQGWRPPARPSFISLASTEQVYAHAEVEVLQFGGGSPGGIVGEPSADESLGWTLVDSGTVHMTTLRFACQLARQFANIPYRSIADAYCDEDGVCVWQHERAPVKLRLVDPEWHFVLFRWLAYGEPRVLPAS